MQTDFQAPGGTGRGHGETPGSGRNIARGLVQSGLVAVICAAPLLIGGGPTWAQVTTCALVFVLTAFLVLTRAFSPRAVPLLGLGLATVVVTLVQVVPWPINLVALLSPRAAELRRGLPGGAGVKFIPLSLDVPGTMIELCKAMSYLALFAIVTVVARRITRARLLLNALGLVGGALAVIALLQKFVGAQSILGLYVPHEHAGLSFFGTFVNGNHAAAFLVLSALIAFGVSVESAGGWRATMIVSALLSLLVLGMTGGRSAFAGMAIGMGTFLGCLLARRFGAIRGAALAILMVLTTIVPALLTSDTLRARLSGEQAILADNQKTRGWFDAARMIADYPWTGVGRGAFEAPITAYRTADESVRLVVPESLPLQLASEWGGPFALALLAFLGAAVLRIGHGLGTLEASVQGAACAVLAIFVQEMASFSLELTGVAFPVVAALGVVVGRVQERVDPRRVASSRIPRRWSIVFMMAWGAALAGAVWSLPRTLLADGARLRKALVDGGSLPIGQLEASISRHPADYYLSLLGAMDAIERDPVRADLLLARAVRLYPRHGVVHQMRARLLARRDSLVEAAEAYRTAAVLGLDTAADELYANLGPDLLPASVPQNEARLMWVAGILLDHNQVDLASLVSLQAIRWRSGNEAGARERLALAERSGNARFILDAADDLWQVARTPESFLRVAGARTRGGDPQGADLVLKKAMEGFPADADLVLLRSRLKMEQGDLAGASRVLHDSADQPFSLTGQANLQGLQALIAEKRGDTAGALAARARERLLSQARSESK